MGGMWWCLVPRSTMCRPPPAAKAGHGRCVMSAWARSRPIPVWAHAPPAPPKGPHPCCPVAFCKAQPSTCMRPAFVTCAVPRDIQTNWFITSCTESSHPGKSLRAPATRLPRCYNRRPSPRHRIGVAGRLGAAYSIPPRGRARHAGCTLSATVMASRNHSWRGTQPTWWQDSVLVRSWKILGARRPSGALQGRTVRLPS